MPTPTYTPLAKFTVTSNTAQINITNINQSYLDLVLVYDLFTDQGGDMEIRYNGDGSTSYSLQSVGNNQNSRVARRENLGYYKIPSGGTSGVSVTMQIKDYAKTNKVKTAIITYTNDIETFLCNTSYFSTNAISSISITRQQSVVITPGSTISLYGIVG
jgi:hypothetical protein